MTVSHKEPLVLLVDDDASFLEIASRTLRMAGFRTETAGNADEGLRKAEELGPDFVLSDLMMEPGQTGWEFASNLERDPRTRDTKIAFFTSLGDPAREYRERFAARLGDGPGRIPVFDKCNDVSSLGDRLRAIGKNVA